MATQVTPQEVRFGEYVLDLRSGELRRDGTTLKLQPQPAKVLSILASRAGEVVTRQELAASVWGSDTFVDFEHGLNFAIQQIRSVLNDNAKEPQFLETLPKRGYRFIAPIVDSPAKEPTEPPTEKPGPSRRPKHLIYGSLAGLAVIGMLTWGYQRAKSTSATTGRIQSLAVLPLHNLSNDPEQQYFSDGMTDELITDLAKAGNLRVISHTSVEGYKDTKRPLPEIARELGVDAIVEGTVMRSGEKVRITAQLIDARSDRHMWADSYERDLHDVFALQDEVAHRIVSEIGTNLVSPDSSHIEQKRGTDPATYEAYLRGNFYSNQFSCAGFLKARQYFQQAVDSDSGFARAYVGLSESDFEIVDLGCSPGHDLIAKSKMEALKALALDPTLGEAHAWLGKAAFFFEWDFVKADAELKQAIALSPNYPEGHIIYAVFLETTGKRDAGIAELKKAREIDPISQLPNVIAIVVFYLARQYDAAVEQGEKTVELYPQSVWAYDWLATSYEKKGMNEKASAAYLRAMELQGVPAKDLSELKIACEQYGVRGFWLKQLENAEKNKNSNACWLTSIHAHLGDQEKAFEYLVRSSHEHCGPHTILTDPIFDNLRDTPRFKELLPQGLGQS